MATAQTALLASRQLLDLPRCLELQAGFLDVVRALRQGEPATFDGVWGSACALLAAALANHAPGPMVVVTARPSDLDDLADDLELFHESSNVVKFPAWESELGERIVHDEIYGDRLRLLKQLVAAKSPDGQPALILTSVQSLLQPVPARDQLGTNTRTLSVGDKVDLDGVLTWLTEHGFHNTSAVELPGEFSSRGGIVDIFAPDWQQPVRVELFGDAIESMRRFDVSSQRSLEPLDKIDVTLLKTRESEHEHFSAYLPSKSWVLLVEPASVNEQAEQYLRLVSHPQDYHSAAGVLARLAKFPVATAASLAEGSIGATCRFQIESVERFSGDFDHVRRQLDKVGQGHEVHVVAVTDAEVERLQEILRSTSLASRGQLKYCVGCLHQGFRLVKDSIVLVSGDQLFHRGELRRTARRRLGKAIDSFVDLRTGDLVVHLAHGIGRYRGLKLLTKEEQVEEHLEVEFHGGTRIYVPASKIGLVQKYIGGTRSRPVLAKVGGTAWLKQKKAAEQAVTDLAAEMLQMQAARKLRPGIAFNADSDWHREFNASFPYQETPDQLTAWSSIHDDMLCARPMDRLLCGDVGFGKTEVAMRAAFKAVESGYQVAVLAPTTILVEQHFQTFCQRMAEFPFDIAKLSRFCTPKQQREIVGRLALGQTDIVVGTHRLASKDVDFYNLGLVVIDEEQRFGVEVKERLKTLRETVDVLTMSATPIPRTLHMSLVGVRDISNLETPPEDRLAVETRVTRFDPDLIRHAVLRELNRGGQIFFVHNRVNDIHVVEQKLKHIVPEARLAIGHGQMPEGELERVMVDFVGHEFDLLLATTIVESGLDIPNANTIFIDEADRYGLAELHQLRGRVGRYKHRAYCYLLVDPHKHLTPNASRRLRAIEEFSDMGAGFAIAMRDLEIRGAGNLLGTQQSGHIAAIGYELYCQLLETAVLQLKKMPSRLTVDVDIDLPGEAYLPDEYVPDIRLKIDLYRRFSRIASYDQLSSLRDEMLDRFGALPESTKRMLALKELCVDAAVWQIQAIHLEQRYLVFTYSNRRRIEQLAKLCSRRLRVVDDSHAYLTLAKGVEQPEQIIAAAKSVLSLG